MIASTFRTRAADLARTALGAVLGLGLAGAVVFQPVDAFAQARSRPAATVRDAGNSGPALWVVRDADSTIYLFGTVHLLRPQTVWRWAKVENAFDSASEIWFEFANVNDSASVQPVIREHGLSPDRPLSGLLTPEEFSRLTAAAATIGVPEAQINASRPWFAAVTLTVAGITKAGYDPQSGGELILRQRADAAHKTVRGFETADQQVRLLAGMPEADQLSFLRGTLEEFDQGAENMDRLVDTWAAGDVAGLQPLVVDGLRSQSEELYRTILVRRNTDWAGQIQHILEGSGTVFIAVGGGHLLGPDSVQTILERRGVEVDEVR